MARSFAGKTVVVSGAGGGLGRALGLQFGAVGARIVALDRDAAGLADTAAALAAAGTACCPVAGDVTRPQRWSSAVAEARRAFGGIDVLVHNAGITHRSAFARTDPDVIRRVLEVNFFGAVLGTHAALADLVARRGMLIACITQPCLLSSVAVRRDRGGGAART